MDYEIAKQISYLTAIGLFEVGVIGYYAYETIKHIKNERMEKRGLEKKIN